LSEDGEIITLGIDLGGTKVATALVDATGHILASHRRLTYPEQGSEGVIADIVACVNECLGEASKKAQGIGIGVAGQVGRDGTVRFAPNLGWHNVPIKEQLEQALGQSVMVNNDVRAATFGEWQHGAGWGVNDLVCLFLGTGIGGGVVSGGRLLEGCYNSAGELGHSTIIQDGRRCRCSNRGCLEAYAGGWAIAERAGEAVQAAPQAGQRLVALAGDIQGISAITVAQARDEGDTLAIRLMDETAQYLAAGVVSMANIFNPCLVVLGGSVMKGMADYIPGIEQAVRQRALPSAGENLRIVTAALGDNAGVIGAAALAREQVRSLAEPMSGAD